VALGPCIVNPRCGRSHRIRQPSVCELKTSNRKQIERAQKDVSASGHPAREERLMKYLELQRIEFPEQRVVRREHVVVLVLVVADVCVEGTKCAVENSAAFLHVEFTWRAFIRIHTLPYGVELMPNIALRVAVYDLVPAACRAMESQSRSSWTAVSSTLCYVVSFASTPCPDSCQGADRGIS
jgi:hypothetical protein